MIPTGYQTLIMDGSTANRPGRTYGIFDYGVYPKAGQTKVLGFLVGQVMKQSGGKANAAQVNELLKKKL